MKLSELVAGWFEFETSQDREINGISLDSRTIQTGEAFIALADLGHIGKALEAGAVAILVDTQINLSGLKDLTGLSKVVFVPIANLASKLPDIVAHYYGYPSRKLDVIGITGTNGKTSCSQFLAQVLADSVVIGTLGWGTWGNVQFTGYTTPDVLLLQKILAETVKLGKKTAVMEVSSHGVQEKRIAQTLFKGAVFTNLSRDHLDYHGSMEDYFQAKLQLFKRPELEFAVINQDDDYGQKIIAAVAPTVKLWTFTRKNLSGLKDLTGLNNLCVQAKNIHCSMHGIQFEVCCNGETAVIHSRLYGEFNIENMLAVLTTLLALGFNLQDATRKVSALQSVPGRMEYFGGDGKPAVFVDYAHTPDALEKVLHGLKEHATEQLAVVFGCGGNRDTGKRPLMGEIASRLADKVIVTDDNPRFEEGDSIVADILTGCQSDKVTVIRDRATAIQTAISEAGSDDCVVIAGKGHEDYQEIRGVKNPFSDQAVVKQALEMWTE